MKNKWKLSASLIQSFKACPTRCNYQYVLGIRPVEDTESQRMGTNWHKIQEIYNEQGMDAVIEHLNKVYEQRPVSKTQEEWETERVILLYSLIGYNWYYWTEETNNAIETIANELKFTLPVRAPLSGRALPRVQLVGKIDRVEKSTVITSTYEFGRPFIRELKSTGSSIDSDSSYWSHLNLDTQTTLYIYAANFLGYEGVDLLYDVWHKPQIRPKKLTQADSKQFVEDGQYCGQEFEVIGEANVSITVNDVLVGVELGKKEGTFAIRETPEMFGARLLQDICERPEFYFARRTISKTEDDLKAFEIELYNIYQSLRMLDRTNGWWKDERQCEATFKCPYINFCYNNVKPDVNNLSPEFKCIFEKEKKNGNLPKGTT